MRHHLVGDAGDQLINDGIGRPGFTSDSNTSSRRSPWTTTTAMSVIRSSPRARMPVVSTSTTAKAHSSM